jgi:hypothetical protein
MKFLFKYTFVAIALILYYTFSLLYIIAHVLFVGNLQYDKGFVSMEHITYEQTESHHQVYIYSSIAHKLIGVAKAQYSIPKKNDR